MSGEQRERKGGCWLTAIRLAVLPRETLVSSSGATSHSQFVSIFHVP